MGTLSKRSTIYFEPAIHQALKIRSASSHILISKNEPEISYEALLSDLKKHGKI